LKIYNTITMLLLHYTTFLQHLCSFFSMKAWTYICTRLYFFYFLLTCKFYHSFYKYTKSSLILNNNCTVFLLSARCMISSYFVSFKPCKVLYDNTKFNCWVKSNS
jgi:hypothetical protein